MRSYLKIKSLSLTYLHQTMYALWDKNVCVSLLDYFAVFSCGMFYSLELMMVFSLGGTQVQPGIVCLACGGDNKNGKKRDETTLDSISHSAKLTSSEIQDLYCTCTFSYYTLSQFIAMFVAKKWFIEQSMAWRSNKLWWLYIAINPSHLKEYHWFSKLAALWRNAGRHCHNNERTASSYKQFSLISSSSFYSSSTNTVSKAIPLTKILKKKYQ